MTEEVIRGLEPVAGLETRILILGTMPGAESLRLQQYYAQARNRFWRVMEAVLNSSMPADYQDRLRVLGRAGIGLWDVLEECERAGSSLDSRIRAAKPNAVMARLRSWPRIRALAFNGKTAADLFDRLIVPTGSDLDEGSLALLRLPSTSPANAAYSVDALASKWRAILTFL